MPSRRQNLPATIRRAFALAAVLASAAVLVACGEKLNARKAESVIRDDLNTRFAAQSLKLSAVVCPEQVRMKQGNGFTCQAQFEGGGTLPVEVAQTDDKGTIEWTVKQRLLLGAVVEKQIVDKAQAGGQEIAVSCGDRVRVVVPQAKFQCMAKDTAGRLLVFDVVVQNEEGDVHWEQVAQ
jgi:hypothetical protein